MSSATVSESQAATAAPTLPVAAAGRRRATWVLLVSAPLLLTWRYFGTQQFYLEHLLARWQPFADPTTAATLYRYVCAFVLLGVVPAGLVKVVFRQKLRDYGVQWGIAARTLRSMLMLAPVFALAAWIGAGDATVGAHYPLDKAAGDSLAAFALHVAGYLLFYCGWEFYFRGFMQHGLREALGDFNAILVQTLASSLLHIGDPTSEAFGAVAVGILWGLLAFRTRSLISGLVQHATLGIVLDAVLVVGRR